MGAVRTRLKTYPDVAPYDTVLSTFRAERTYALFLADSKVCNVVAP
jgi:hypothetical protein